MLRPDVLEITSGQPPRFTSHPLLFLSLIFSRWTLTEREKAGLKRTLEFRDMGRGYFMEQGTQPQTLGYSLADSPSGLLAWIYEKLVNWTDEYKWDDEEGWCILSAANNKSYAAHTVLTWISIYWFSRAGPAASVRIYYEFLQSKDKEYLNGPRPTIPLGYSHFPKELVIVPKSYVFPVLLVICVLTATGGVAKPATSSSNRSMRVEDISPLMRGRMSFVKTCGRCLVRVVLRSMS